MIFMKVVKWIVVFWCGWCLGLIFKFFVGYWFFKRYRVVIKILYVESK